MPMLPLADLKEDTYHISLFLPPQSISLFFIYVICTFVSPTTLSYLKNKINPQTVESQHSLEAMPGDHLPAPDRHTFKPVFV